MNRLLHGESAGTSCVVTLSEKDTTFRFVPQADGEHGEHILQPSIETVDNECRGAVYNQMDRS
jgi:hypothetical protein